MIFFKKKKNILNRNQKQKILIFAKTKELMTFFKQESNMLNLESPGYFKNCIFFPQANKSRPTYNPSNKLKIAKVAIKIERDKEYKYI